MSAHQVVVLGAGIQGICVTLGLLQRGYRVTLIDKAPTFFSRASLRNEGKIHLGLVYANDASFQTADLMLRAALEFGPQIESLLGRPLQWPRLVSQPFVYVVARDSLLSTRQLVDFYERLDTRYRELLTRNRGHYLGTTPQRLYWPLPPSGRRDRLSRLFALDQVQTAELALQLPAFRQELALSLDTAELLRTRYGHKVREIQRVPAGFRVCGIDPEGAAWSIDAGIVVNCLWEERLKLDAQLGLLPQRPWVYRLKYRVMADLPPTIRDIPSMTFVLGPYGDVVRYRTEPSYLSWYPTCKRGWSDSLTIPPDWQDACDGRPDPRLADEIAHETLDNLDQIIPGIAAARVRSVDAGVIFSWGATDIDDRHSELHRRNEIGVSANDGYYSVDTGKFTTAPMFARQLLDLL